MCVAIANTGAALRWQSYSPLTRCRLPGPDDPSTAVGRPEICASAPAAKAPASSLRTWTNSMSDSCRRSASTIGFAESPTMPYTLRIPTSTIWSTRISATVWAMGCSCVLAGLGSVGLLLDGEVLGLPHRLVDGLDRVGDLHLGDAGGDRRVHDVDGHRRRHLAQPGDVREEALGRVGRVGELCEGTGRCDEQRRRHRGRAADDHPE